MNHVIMCEGKTDAILLSYYLCRKYGWEYCNKGPDNIIIKDDEESEVNWYKRDSDMLLICGVGGCSKFKKFFEQKLWKPIKDGDAFDSIVVIVDKDDNSIEQLERKTAADLYQITESVKNRVWISKEYKNSFSMKKTIKILLLVIPVENEGALENVLMDAIAENPYDKNIVDKSKQFVNEIKPEVSDYINSKRLISKAQLGVIWAIQNPQRNFDPVDQQIKSVQWEQYEVISNCFEPLKEL